MQEEFWNNSWMKNLLVRPLAPRRKTPGQLNPSIDDLPGWVTPDFFLEICELQMDRNSFRNL